MIVVSDTSAITALLQIGRIDHDDLQRLAGFRVSERLKARVLAEAGE